MQIVNGELRSVDKSDLTSSGMIIVPAGVTVVNALSFLSVRDELLGVVMPDSLVHIGVETFYSFPNLRVVSTGNGCETIEAMAFQHCQSLFEVKLGCNVKHIEPCAFADCVELAFINLPEGLETLAWGTFYNCTNLQSLPKIPSTVWWFGSGAFHTAAMRSTWKNYKAFNITKTGKYKCRDKEYKIGKKAFVKGSLSLCERGLHFCTNLFEIFDYYQGEYGKDFVVAEIETFGEVITSNSSKCCARGVIPTRILSREEVIKLLNREEIDA